jgi:CBS domain-containing protein
MSSEPSWRGSLHKWEERARQWSVRSSEETLLKAQNFFSFRFLYGDEELNNAFNDTILRQLKSSKILLVRMAQVEKTKPVPVLHSSIRSLLGMQRKEFSMKKEILFPFHHALQILNLAHGNTTGSTLEKIEYLVEKGSISPGFGDDLTEAFEEMMKLYMELKRNKQGDIVQLSTLSTREKENLYHSVKTIREFQNMMLAHYSLA